MVRAVEHLEIRHADIPLEAITAHPRNYRRHPQQQIDRLRASLRRFGQVRSIVVQEGKPGSYLAVAGHGVCEAAREEGYTHLKADIIPATWTPAQVEGYLIADNMGGADDDQLLLAAMLQEQAQAGASLESLGYSRDDLDALIAQLGDAYMQGAQHEVDDPGGGGDDFDTTPNESDAPTRVQPGDLWQLGDHRLLCGDSTKAADVARLMDGETAQMVFTDPPYGVDLLKQRGRIGNSRVYRPVLNDNDTNVAIAAYNLAASVLDDAVQIWWGANYYADALPATPCWLVWDKDHHGMTFADAELAWVNRSTPVRCFRHAWSGMHRDSERNEQRSHPTQKPVALAAWAFEEFGTQDDVVVDLFAGSGFSVIAAERTERRCYAIELDPRYCDVILRRWEAETGREAVLLSHAEGVA